MNTQTKLSAMWLFVTLNYLYCDVLGLMDPVLLNQTLTGSVNGLQFTPGVLLGAGILIEIPIAIVLLSLILPERANRRVNILAGAVMTLVQLSTLLSRHQPYYIFFSIIEIAVTAYIVRTAWMWSPAESRA